MVERPSGTVTFLFTDAEASSRESSELTPSGRSDAARAEQAAVLRETLEASGGYVYKAMGDGIALQVAFATAPQAIDGALQAQRALARDDGRAFAAQTAPEGRQHRSSTDDGTDDASLSVVRRPSSVVRMALHTGVTEEREGDYVGPLLNRVARLLAAGHGGQVLLTLATQELVRSNLPSGVTLHDLGEHRLKDLTRPEQIFQLVAPDLPSEFPPLRTLEGHPNNLPLQPTLLVGRDREVEECCELLRREDVWLLTLTGPGGIGKTRLGLQIAAEVLDHFADGAFFISLAPLTDPELVPITIAHTLGVREQGSKPLVETLKDHLADKQMLLMLDNFEQVLETAPLVAELLDASLQLKVMVTSRTPLRLVVEHEYPVPPLSLPARTGLTGTRAGPDGLSQYEAVALFVARAQAANPGFKMTPENAAAVAEICNRLDGLPLAIELAAARAKILSPQAMLARLAEAHGSAGAGASLKLLTGGRVDLPLRQQTMRNTIDWSYSLLKESERILFRRLAVFVGGCTLEAAEAVAAPGVPTGVGDRGSGVGVFTEAGISDPKPLTSDKGSPAPDPQPPLAGAHTPIDVLEGIGSLLDKNLLRQEEAFGQPRFWMLQTIREYALERLRESGEEEELRRRHVDFYLELAEQGARESRGRQQVAWLDRLEREHDNVRSELEWKAPGAFAAEIRLRLAGAMWMFWWRRGYLSEGRQRLAEALAEADDSNARPPLATERARRLSSRARALYGAGYLAFLQGDYAEARELFEQSLALYKEVGDKWGIATVLTGMGHEANQRGDLKATGDYFEESLAIRKELGDRLGTATALNNLALSAAGQGDYDSARDRLEECLAIFRELGDKWGITFSLNNLSLVARAQEDYDHARSFVKESLAIRVELGDRLGIAYCVVGIAAGLAAEGGKRTMDDGRPTAEGGDSASVETSSTLVLERAAALFGAADALLESIGARLEPLFRAECEMSIAATREMLGEEKFATAWERGRAMTLEETIAYARENAQSPVL
jgi:predicted ATPase/class 3 adenylate cyclase